MSLHALASHMATKGRGGDSMLVHMTPGEVQALQALAERHGGTLTINPETGQPEANFLKKMLPMIAGFALGPAGFGLMSAQMAGLAVGGVTALSTGSLSRGLMAGLGAYGGASLGAGLSGAGAGAAQEAAVAGLTTDQIAQQAVASGLTEQGVLNQAAANATKDFLAKGVGDRLMEGASAAFNDPKAFMTGMGGTTKALGAAYAAASPMMAADTVETTTKRPDTGYIRNFTFDPYGQTYSDAGSYPASEYKGMAEGGIVALANGGMPAAISQDYVNQLVREAAQQAGGTLSFADAANAAKNLGISADMLSSAASNTGLITGAPAPVAGPAAGSAAYNSMVGNFFNQNPNLTAADVSSAMSTYGLNQADVANAMRASGLSNAAQFAAFQPDVGVPSTPLGGLAGLSSNINQFLGQYPDLKRSEAERAMDIWGYNEADIVRATGKTLDELFKETKKPPVKTTTVLPGLTDTSNLAGGVSGGGSSVVNPNGTITTFPNIPGRPPGGFTGMGQLRDVYTQGGGSLGYANPAPTTMEEFNQRFNRQTGDSLAAYEYLMGKGANPIKSGVGEIMRPYSEAVRGVPAAEGRPAQKYIYDPVKRVYVENPNYRPMSYNTKGERMVGMTSAEVIKGLQGLKDPADDSALFDFVSSNRISEAQLAAALGISIAEARARLAAGKKLADGTAAREAAAAAAAATDPYSSGAANGGLMSMAAGGYAVGGGLGSLAKGGVAELPDNAFVVPARITSEIGNGSTNAGAQKLFAMEQRLLGKNARPVNLGRYSGGGNLVRGKGDGVSDSVPATIGGRQPARIADGEVVISSEAVKALGKGSAEAGARKLYAMMDRVQKARGKTTGKNRVAANTRSDKYLPA